jgi:uncharacterized alpha-E superfamily protein
LGRENSDQNQTSSEQSNSSVNSLLGVDPSSIVSSNSSVKANARSKRASFTEDNKPKFASFRLFLSHNKPNDEKPINLDSLEQSITSVSNVGFEDNFSL